MFNNKYLIISLFVTAGISHAHGQLVSGSFVKNILIGEGAANDELTIYDNDLDGDAVIRLKSGDGTVEMVYGFNPSSGGLLGTQTDTKLTFRTNGTTRMMLDSNGDLGLGGLPHNAELTIYDRDADGDAVLRLRNGSGTREVVLGYNPSSGGLVGTQTDLPLTLRTNGSTRMTVLGNGNVGIGDTNPDQKLVVDGNMKVEGELRRPASGSADLIPVCYGSIESATIVGGTGNFVLENSDPGIYLITVDNEVVSIVNSVIVVTLRGDPGVITTSFDDGRIIIKTFNFGLLGPELGNRGFNFVLFMP